MFLPWKVKNHILPIESFWIKKTELLREHFTVFFFGQNQNLSYQVIKSGLVGVSRELLVDYLTKNNIAYDFKSIHYDKVNRYQEMYLMNSVYGVIPIKKYDEFTFDTNLEIVKELNRNLNLEYAKK